jgi:hypothetical protein
MLGTGVSVPLLVTGESWRATACAATRVVSDATRIQQPTEGLDRLVYVA